MKAVCFVRVCAGAVLGGVGLLLGSCSGEMQTEQARVPLPTGHYEGPISYQGSELRVALDLRETTPGRLQAEVSFPQMPGLGFEAARLSYQEPQLRLEQWPGQVGSVAVQAVREGDFLRGVLSWENVRTDFVWARRGEAAPRGFREQPLPLRYAGRAQAGRLLIPDDTLAQHPAVAFFTAPATLPGAQNRAAYLARHGVATLVVTTPSPTDAADSSAFLSAQAVLQALRRQAAVDSSRVGCWVRGNLAPLVVSAAAEADQPAAFVVLESVPAATREAASAYQVLGQRRIPTLALYAGLDTTVAAAESARRLRLALGNRRGTQVRTFPQATAEFIQPGQVTSDGQWQWPRSAPGYWEGVLDWLQQR